MKANLQTAEPEAIARWDSIDLYGKLREKRRGAPKFVLHDGPPYANGNIHLGTALNKTLKDFVVKGRSMAGYDAPYVPGYDCHGLPIELRVERELGPKKRQLTVAEFRRACRAYADRFIGVMSDEFRRLGVFGLWSNPYLTMKPAYQASIVRALSKFVEQGMVYKGKKPVHWCIHCRTALAEAEVEYEPHSSPSIYVEFPLDAASASELGTRVPELAGKNVSALIWTTTPWTIPSNLALAFHPEFTYAAYPVDGTHVVVAEQLAEQVATITGRTFGAPVASFPGARLEHLVFKHPLYNRASLAVVGDYVTLEQGTGVVHTAPGHGADDFHTGVKYGLEIYAPIGPGGHFLDTVELFGGQRVFDANPKVEEALKQRGRLWHRETFEHSYPHCWRCHNPVIFLATSQWFISMDATGLRARALNAIDDTRWIPAWGRDRIYNMIAFRPDWCISRQRAWGVPIPALTCTSCGTPLLTKALTDRAADVFEQYPTGADVWYEGDIAQFIPEGLTCPSCGGTSFDRETNILDVWFDSGSSHEAVLPFYNELTWPADMYLEGSDQHRGWFHSSLLIGIGTRGRAPFNQVLTHGFTLDVEGEKMSKSRGNTILPEEIIRESGADVLRLWVATVDYREEVRVSREILSRIVEAYRKLRNTCRILVANLYDFDPARDMVPLEGMEEVDRYTLARYGEAAQRMITGYEEYDFPTVSKELTTLATVDLSAFYIDVTKDRMYTYGAKSQARRSGQTAMYLMADGLARLMAPILPFTADELWRHLPPVVDTGAGEGLPSTRAQWSRRSESVHLEVFPKVDHLVSPDLQERWARLMAVRDDVNAALEEQRKHKVIGNSLSANVRIATQGAVGTLLEQYRAQLPTLFIVSDVALDVGPADAADQVRVAVERASGVKCDRCWRYVPAVTTDPDRAGICDRCVEALAEPVNQ